MHMAQSLSEATGGSHLWVSPSWDSPVPLFTIHGFLPSFFQLPVFIFLVSQGRKPVGFSLFATVLLCGYPDQPEPLAKTPEMGTYLRGPPLPSPSKRVPLPRPPDCQPQFGLQYFLFHVQVSCREGGWGLVWLHFSPLSLEIESFFLKGRRNSNEILLQK